MFLNQKGIAPIFLILLVIGFSSTLAIVNKSINLSSQPDIEKDANIPIPSYFPTPTLDPSTSPTPAPTATPSAKPTGTPKPISSVAPTLTPKPQPAANNTPPGSGFSSQVVSADGQNYKVYIIAADLNSTRVIVDTASDSDCSNNCPAMSLGDYVSRNGAYAGINGSFFCPPEYPSCSGKTNSFDTLVMNKNKRYFNSDNNVYSTIPAAIFSQGSARFVSQSLEWGRDTGVDAVIANYPLLVAGNNIVFTENPSEPKFGGKGARTFIANKGNMVYIGVVFGASMGESAKVLHALGMDQAMNLDEGGSTALWSGGYKVGPGRNIPNAVLFIQR